MLLYQRPQHLAINLSKLDLLYIYTEPFYNFTLQALYFKKLSPHLFLTLFFNLADKLIISKNKIYHFYSTDIYTDIDTLKRFQKKGIVWYDYIDEISQDISSIPIPDSVFARHKFILENDSIVVTASAKKLYTEVLKARGSDKNLAYVTNGVDSDYFFNNQNLDLIKENIINENFLLKIKNKNVIGYYGALANWFDFENIMKLAKSRSDLILLLIGLDYDGSLAKSGLAGLDNVIFLGRVDYKYLPSLAQYFDISIIPFKINAVTESTSPVKLFEYMASGKPIISTNLPECKNYKNIYFYSHFEELSKAIDTALIEKEIYKASLIEQAKENDWSNKAKQIFEVLNPNL